jgi:hypothetical protein
MVQNPSSHCRDSTGRKGHADDMMSHPGPLYPFWQSSGILCLHMGTPAIGRTAASQRRREGVQGMGMPIVSGTRRHSIGMRWIRCWLLRPFGPSLVPL